MNNSACRALLILAVPLITLSSKTAIAADPAWMNIGPSPPALEAPIAVDPYSRTIYMGTFGGGVLKSTDGGETFAAANNGLRSLAITSMAMDPTNPNNVVAGTGGNGIFRTVDGGATWIATSETNTLPVVIVVDPSNPQIWYAGYGGGNTAAVKKSLNGGADWVRADTGIPATTIFSIAVDPRDGSVLYAGSGNSGGFKSTNHGASWTPLPLQPVVWSVAIDPTDSQVIYAGMNGDGVLKSIDGGATFSRVGSLDVGVVLAVVVDPTNSQHVYAGTVSGGLALSKDGGRTWKKTSLRTGIIVSLSATDDGSIYAGTGFDGAFASLRNEAADGDRMGRTELKPVSPSTREKRFAPIARNELRAINAQNVYSVTVDPHDSRHLILGTNDGGLIGSTDGGQHWIDTGDGLLNRAPRKAVYDPRFDARLYVGSFAGGGLYRSDDNGLHWTRHMFGSPAVYVWAVAVDPQSGAVYAGTNGEGLWKSEDDAATFTRVDGTLIPQVRSVAFDPSTAGKVLVASLGGIWRSLDNGVHFTKVSTAGTLTLAVDPSNPSVVYAGTQSAGVLKSVDGGATFSASGAGLPALRMSRSGPVAIDPTNTSTLYVGTEGAGVFKSVNAGATWTPINTGLSELNIFALALDARQPNVLYVGGPGGVFKTVTGGE